MITLKNVQARTLIDVCNLSLEPGNDNVAYLIAFSKYNPGYIYRAVHLNANNRVIGFVRWVEGREVELLNLIVDPVYRGQGIEREIGCAIIRDAKTRGEINIERLLDILDGM